jgi:hypothetical protein
MWNRMITLKMAACGLMLAATPVSAQDMAGMAHAAPVDCTHVPRALPPELAGWSNRTAAPAAKDAAGLTTATLSVGSAFDAKLTRTSDVRYALAPEKLGGSASFGGMFSITIRDAGIYRVALGSGGWIDMLKDGKPVESSNHGHGPDCSGVRKMVDFPLTSGRYVLQLAASGAVSLPVMVARRP